MLAAGGRWQLLRVGLGRLAGHPVAGCHSGSLHCAAASQAAEMQRAGPTRSSGVCQGRVIADDAGEARRPGPGRGGEVHYTSYRAQSIYPNIFLYFYILGAL